MAKNTSAKAKQAQGQVATAATAPKAARKSVQMRIPLGEARDVILTGDFTGWATDKLRLNKAANGEWTGTVELTPGEYQYRLLVDGQWRDDPAAQAHVPNQFGSTNCVLKVQA